MRSGCGPGGDGAQRTTRKWRVSAMLDRNMIFWLLGGAGMLYLLTRADVRGFAQTGVDDVTAAMAGWKQVQKGSVWVPVINQTESANGIPTDLLARMAYQESHFRPDIISGIKTSSVGALGILQLMPQFFQTVNVPIPCTTSDVLAQISEAARYLQSLY